MSDFKLKQNPTFWRPLTLKALDGVEMSLELEMRHKRKSELKALDALLKTADRPSDEDLVEQLVAGWRRVDTPFSQEAFRELMEQYPAAAPRIWDEYQEAYQAAARKN